MGVIVKILVLLLAIGGGMVYKNVSQLWVDLPAPQLDPQQWWGDEAEPEDYAAYLANNSEVIGNRLSYPEKVRGITYTYCILGI